MAVTTDEIEDLWKASLALGLAYGSMFGLFPTITFEWFGMRKLWFGFRFSSQLIALRHLKLISLRTGVSFPSHL